MFLSVPSFFWNKQVFAEEIRNVRLAEWKPNSASSNCDSCAKSFDFFRRKHHCRLCGGLFCHNCSNTFFPLELLLRLLFDLKNRGMNTPGCFSKMMWSESRRNITAHGGLLAASDSNTVVAATKATTRQRVCTRCYKVVHFYSLKERSCQESLGKYINKLRKDSNLTRFGGWNDVHVPVVCGRERKICVIFLQEGSLVDSCKHTDLDAFFVALEKLTTSNMGMNAMTGKDGDLSLGPSLSSASDNFASDKNVIDTSGDQKWTATTTASASNRTERASSRLLANTAVMQKRKKFLVQVSVPLKPVGVTDNMGADAGVNVNVSVQLVGVCYRHGSDRALLQRYTIGTDAYIILLNGEIVSSSFSCATTTDACGGMNITFSAPLLASPLAVRFFTTAGTSPTATVTPSFFSFPVHTTHECPLACNLAESVCSVLGALVRYSGSTPICAVMSCGPCNAAGGGDVGAAGPGGGIFFGYNRHPTAGVPNLRNNRRGAARGATTEAQASALHNVLRSIIADVIQREVLRQEE